LDRDQQANHDPIQGVYCKCFFRHFAKGAPIQDRDPNQGGFCKYCYGSAPEPGEQSSP
jgi:hypothetical protein